MEITNESYFLAPTLKELINSRNRQYGEDDSFFIRIFPFDKRIAILNNYEASKFANGYVSDIHKNLLNSKVVSTIHDKLIAKITNNVGVEGETDKDVEDIKNSIINFEEALQQTTNYLLARGEVCLVNELVDNKVLIKTYPLGRYDLRINQFNEIEEAYLFKQLFDGNTNYVKYVLMEHRFKKNDKAYKEYNVVQFQYHKLNDINEDLEKYALEQKDLPPTIKQVLGDLEINKPIALNQLGVFRIKNTAINKMAPFSDIGESQYLNVIDDAVALDTNFTSREVDKYLGRGRVMVPSLGNAMPQAVQITSDGKVAKSIPHSARRTLMDNTFIQSYENLNAMNGDGKPQSVQFDLRTTQWLEDKNSLIGEICTKCGLSVYDYNPTMFGGIRTAREIDELGDITAQTIKEKQNKLGLVINKLLSEICELLGRADLKLFVRWDKSTNMNAQANLELVINKYRNGLISKESALKDLNPNWSLEEIKAELDRINSEVENSSADVLFNNL